MLKKEKSKNNNIDTTKKAPKYSLNLSAALSYPSLLSDSNCNDFNLSNTDSVILLFVSTIDSLASTVPWNLDTLSNLSFCLDSVKSLSKRIFGLVNSFINS